MNLPLNGHWRVIQGGQPLGLSPKNHRKKLNQLRDIENTLIRAQFATARPRFGRAMAYGLVTATVYMGIISFLPHRPESSLILFSPMIVGFVVMVGVYWRLSHVGYPATWRDMLLEQLAGYEEPESKEAYRWLQDQTKKSGFLNFSDVSGWVAMERGAIRDAQSKPVTTQSITNHDKFIQRKI